MTRMVVTTNWLFAECSDTKIHEQDYDEHGYEFSTAYLCYEIDWNDWLLIYVYPLLWFISKCTSPLPMFAIWKWPLEWAKNTLDYCFEFKTPWLQFKTQYKWNI